MKSREMENMQFFFTRRSVQRRVWRWVATWRYPKDLFPVDKQGLHAATKDTSANLGFFHLQPHLIHLSLFVSGMWSDIFTSNAKVAISSYTESFRDRPWVWVASCSWERRNAQTVKNWKLIFSLQVKVFPGDNLTCTPACDVWLVVGCLVSFSLLFGSFSHFCSIKFKVEHDSHTRVQSNLTLVWTSSCDPLCSQPIRAVSPSLAGTPGVNRPQQGSAFLQFSWYHCLHKGASHTVCTPLGGGSPKVHADTASPVFKHDKTKTAQKHQNKDTIIPCHDTFTCVLCTLTLHF